MKDFMLNSEAAKRSVGVKYPGLSQGHLCGGGRHGATQADRFTPCTVTSMSSGQQATRNGGKKKKTPGKRNCVWENFLDLVL